jgi:hypothetical protein
MRKKNVLYVVLIIQVFLTQLAYSEEINIDKKSGDINFKKLKEYNFKDFLRKYSFDEKLNITNSVTMKSVYFYDKDEHVRHKETIKGYYGNVYFSKNKKYFTIIDYEKKTKLTKITLKDSEFTTIWSNSFNFLSTKRVYISDDGESVIHYGVRRARGFASINFIGKDGKILKKKSGFSYVSDSYAYSPEKQMFLVHGNTACDFNGNAIWTIDNIYKGVRGDCKFSPDGNYIVGIYESKKYNEGDILFIKSDGTIYKKRHVKSYFDYIMNFSYDNKFCMIFAGEEIMFFKTSTGELLWSYDLSTYIKDEEVDLVLYSFDVTYDAKRIALILVPRKIGIYIYPAYLIIFSSKGSIISESVIDGVSKISSFPPLVKISKDGKYLSLKFDKKIVKYMLNLF